MGEQAQAMVKILKTKPKAKKMRALARKFHHAGKKVAKSFR
jgi:hypothetical protein